MNIFPAAELFGEAPSTRAEIIAEATSGAVIQSRAELAAGVSFEPSMVRGLAMVRETYALSEKEAAEVAKTALAELFGKTKEEINEEVALFWRQSREAFFNDLGTGEGDSNDQA